MIFGGVTLIHLGFYTEYFGFVFSALSALWLVGRFVKILALVVKNTVFLLYFLVYLK